MTHKEVFEALLAGKKVKNNSGNILYLIRGNVYFDGDHGYRVLTYIDAETDNYELYEEPAWQVMYKLGEGTYHLSETKFKSKEQFKQTSMFKHVKFIKLFKPEEL